MNTHKKKMLFFICYIQQKQVYIWYMASRWACEVIEILLKEAKKKLLLCEDYNDLTNPTNKHYPDIH